MKRRLTTYWCLLCTNLLAVPGLAEGGRQRCNESEFDGDFIKTRYLFQCNEEKLQRYVKHTFLSRFNNSLNYLKPCFADRQNSTAEASCLDFLGDNHVYMHFLHKNNYFWWYPTVRRNKSDKELTYNFEECNRYLGNLERNVTQTNNVPNCTDISSHPQYALIPFLPWKCQVDNEFSKKIELMVYLYTIKNTLSRHCGDLLCTETKKDTPIPIFSLNTPEDQLCIKSLNEISNRPTCYPESNGFCFYALKEPNTRQSIVFISKDTDTISENKKLVYILRNFTDFQRNGWCEHPLDYTKKIRHLHKYQTYYFCHSRSNNNDRDSWHIRDITESEFLVALNANVSATTIDSNVILQRLLFNKSNISTTVYNNLLKSNYTFKHYTNEFHIPVFTANHEETQVLEFIKQTKHVTITTTEYFTKVEDNVSIWGHLNWIIFHSCSHEYKKDNKGLLLFLYNGTLNLEFICNDNTDVLLTSIRRENVTSLNSTKFARGCFDKGINKETDKDCKNTLQNSTDYETRFFHFLVYPRHTEKLSAVKLLDQKMKNFTEIEIFEKRFHQGTHPSVLGGLTKIGTNPSTSSESDHKGQTISLQKTLQILIMATLSGNNKCIQTLKEGSFSIDINPSSMSNNLQPLYVIGPIPFDISSESCLTILPYDVYDDLLKIQVNKKLRVNKFWPTCMYNKLIAWDESTEGVVLEWDYLPFSCKARETVLFIFCCAITFITIFGNAIVITVVIFSKLIKKHVYMIYTSMAVADLLLGVTSASLALRDTYYLMHGQLTIYDFSVEGPWAPFGTLAYNQPAGFQQTRFPRHGWPAFCAVAMNISILSSLMSLALLGIERLLMFLSILTLKEQTSKANQDNQNGIQMSEKDNRNQNPIRFRDPFANTLHIKIAVFIIWLWNISWAFIINTGPNTNYNTDNTTYNNALTGSFDPITKLTLNTGKGTSFLALAAFYLQVIIASIAGIIIVTATVASAIVFNIHESKMHMNGITIHHPQRQEQVYVITRTFIMMVILFLVSSAPVAVGILTNSLVIDIANIDPVFHFMTWWLFMAGSSWNWIIYCFRGQLFKEKAKEFFQNLWRSL
ncbi:uncharacterized protein [Macrobrachium rosenbergii]|uniref:uncharacterized protein isoform X2 n=1 Tax=Macrobrachium rosenbergii TaxID=79674 RepID=UPI0034D477E1